MKKIWGYISAVLLGLAIGIVVGVKLMGDQISIEIKKIKTKRNSGNTSIPIDIEVPVDRARRTKEQRKADRDERRAKQ